MMRFLIILCICLAAGCGVEAQTYPTSSYKIVGNELVKWLGSETDIDFTKDENLMNVVERIGSNAFANNSNVKTVRLSYTQRTLDAYAFVGCQNLESIFCDSEKGNPSWGAEALRIENCAFRNCKKLKSVAFSKYLGHIEYDAFENCVSLTAFTFSGKHPRYVSESGVVYSRDRDTLVLCPPGLDGHYDVGEKVKTIGNGAFAYSHLSSVYLSNSVQSIGESAFERAEQLKVINFPSTLQVIKKWAFHGCKSLKTMFLPSSLGTIQDFAFRNCMSLPEKVTLPTYLEEFNGSAFSGCHSIKYFEISAENPTFCTEDGVVFSKYKDVLVAFPPGKHEARIPQSVSRIGESAFSASKVQQVYFDTALKDIGYDAFYGCKYLEEIDIPEGVESVGDRSFYDCVALKRVQLPSTLNSLHKSAFAKNDNIRQTYAPRRVYCHMLSPIGGWRTADVVTDTLYVPEESIELYRMAPGWRYFSNIKPLKKPTYFTVSYGQPDNGLLIVTAEGNEIGNGEKVLENSTIVVQAIPYFGYYLKSLKVNGKDIESQVPFSVVDNISISAIFDNDTSLGVNRIDAVKGNVKEVYDLQGRKSLILKKGINIMRTAEGKFIKVIIK